MSTFLVACLKLLLIINIINGEEISATISNSSGDYYITSRSIPNDYQFDILTCSSSNCHIICDGVSSCYSLIIYANHSQSLTIECNEINSCYKSKIVSSSTTTTNLKCHNVNSCYDVNLIVNNLSNLDLECFNGKQGINLSYTDAACKGMNIFATNIEIINAYCHDGDCFNSSFYLESVNNANIFNMEHYSGYKMNIYGSNVIQSLNIDCKDSFSCFQSQIYCPNSYGTECNIKCPSNHSCDSMNIFIPDHQYQVYSDLNFSCNNFVNNSCSLSNINCLNSDGITNWYHSSIDNEWKCDNFECCPYGDGIISCGVDEDCIINCTSTQCTNKNIDASLANSLLINCNADKSCQGSKIQCPNGNGKSCDIICSDSSSCSYSIINGQPEIFSLECSESDSCEWSQISLAVNESLIECTASNSCKNMNITFSKQLDIDSISLSCISSSSCQSLKFDLENIHSINSMDIMCSGDSSCYSLNIYGPNANVSSMDIDCVGTNTKTCTYSNISATIYEDVSVNCGYLSSCTNSSFSFTIQSKAQPSIICSNQYVTDQYIDGACYNAAFHLISYEQDQFSNAYAKCNKYDCYQALFEINAAKNVLIDCTSPSSCDSITIIANESELLTMNCEATDACRDAIILCPYQTVDSCILNCGEYENSCYNTKINVSDNYVYNYLDLTYSTELTKDQHWSGFIEFRCINKKMVRYWYYEDENAFRCKSTGLDEYCCPFLSSINPCKDNEANCVIDCESQNCDNIYINSSNANSATINCADCGGSIVLCPNGGCIINTNANWAISNSKIYYNGTQSDNGILQLNCNYWQYACKNTPIYASNVSTLVINALASSSQFPGIYAEYANNITIICDGGYVHGYCSGHGCRYASDGCNMFVYANYANYVNLQAIGPWAFQYSHLVAEYANSVNVYATGREAWRYSNLYGSHAKSVNINCISGYKLSYSSYTINQPCVLAEWYIGSGNTIFNCWGYGCYKLGNISINDTDSNSLDVAIDINLNECGIEDTSGGEFISSFGIWCDGMYSKYSDENRSDCSYYPSSKDGYEPNNCGCKDYSLGIEIYDKNNESNAWCMYANDTKKEETDSTMQILSYSFVEMSLLYFAYFILFC